MKTTSDGIHYRPHQDPRSSHQQIANLVRELAAERGYAPVLDVGCAQGMLAQAIEGTGVVIDGIELNEQWAAMARPHYRDVFTAPAETAPLKDREYRLVVCGDVLEHLVDPVATLRRLRQAAAEDAKFIVSLPNVAHLAVRLMLVAGKFPKMQRGPLDKTHLHFFTRKTATQMLAQAGLKVERASRTGLPIDEIWKNGKGGLLFRGLVRSQHLMLHLMPGLLAYQWIFVASA
jgi:2-polyprenyl-3-methyl-5-hydroxy-6-metoxy-1,4-benzoquinol methylase